MPGWKMVATGGKTYSVRKLSPAEAARCEQMAKDAGTWQSTGVNRYYRVAALEIAVAGPVSVSALSSTDAAALHAVICDMTDSTW